MGGRCLFSLGKEGAWPSPFLMSITTKAPLRVKEGPYADKPLNTCAGRATGPTKFWPCRRVADILLALPRDRIIPRTLFESAPPASIPIRGGSAPVAINTALTRGPRSEIGRLRRPSTCTFEAKRSTTRPAPRDMPSRLPRLAGSIPQVRATPAASKTWVDAISQGRRSSRRSPQRFR